MTKSVYRVMKLKDIKSNFFVRKTLNQDHVLMLAELYESAMGERSGDMVEASKAVKAIQVTEDGSLLDGRHRKEAMEIALIHEARVELITGLSQAELVVAAAKANYGGALPPTREDMIYTVEQLLSKFNMTQKAVEESMVMLPKSLVRKYINTATKRLQETRLRLAVSDIKTAKLSIAQAAKKHSVKPESVELALEGKKPKSAIGTAQANSAITQAAKGFSHRVHTIITKALEDFRDGDVPEDVVQQAINHYEHCLRRMFIRATDWTNRLKAAKLGEDKGDYTDVDNVIDQRKES